MSHSPLSERIATLILNSTMPLDGAKIAKVIRALMEEYTEYQALVDLTDAEILQRVRRTVELLDEEPDNDDD